MLEVRKSEERGTAQLDWLHSRHTFSFGDYFDPKQLGFSDLRVINDDVVQPGKGFDTHPHADMEIFTYVLTGTLQHRDSMGTGSIIRPGEVQLMSAGSGVQHSEFNPSDSEQVHLLQIWIRPNQKGIKPSYQQADFPENQKRGKLRLIISPAGNEGSLKIQQDVQVYAGLLNANELMNYEFNPNRKGYVHIARGELQLNGIPLTEGDGVRIQEEKVLSFSQGKDAELLLFDLR